MHGRYPAEYERRAYIEEPLAEVYRTFDGFTSELLAEDIPTWINSAVILPPLLHEDRFVRGILLTMGAEWLLARHPGLSELFNVVASAQWCNFPWSRRSDALCSIYANPVRDAWFRATYPERAKQCLVPIQEADWCNERMFSAEQAPRTRELLCVSRQAAVKNLPVIARALKIYEQKYRHLRMTLVAGFNTRWQHLEDEPREVMREMEHALGSLSHYLELVDFMAPRDLAQVYGDHKVSVFGSLLEGKNRALHEAMASDMPVVWFDKFNQAIRGSTAAVPAGAGKPCEFDPESLADCMHEVLASWSDFSPRRSYLDGFSGRRCTFERCLRALPEYAEIPEIMQADPYQNAWIERAIQHVYGCSLDTFVYTPNPCNEIFGVEQHDRLLKFYREACGF